MNLGAPDFIEQTQRDIKDHRDIGTIIMGDFGTTLNI